MLRLLRFLGAIGVVVGMLIIISPDASAQRGGGGGGRGGGGFSGGGRGGFSGGGARGFSGPSSFRAPSSGMRSPSFNPSFNTRSAPTANHLAGPSRGTINGSSFNNGRAGNLNANNLHAGNVRGNNWNSSNWNHNNWNHNNWNHNNWNHNHWAWNTWHGNWHHSHNFWPYFAFGLFGNGFGYPFGWFPWYYGYGSYAALGDYNDSPYYYYQNYPAPANQALGNQEQVMPAVPADGTATIEALLPDASARLWVDGKETTSRGTSRRYATPPLQAGYKYVSTIRVAWQQDGEVHAVERQVPLTANGRVVVDFTQTPSRIMINP